MSNVVMINTRRLRWPTTAVAQRRLIIVAIALVATVLKLLVAHNTLGTNDVHFWEDFARGVDRYGPVGIYGHVVASVPYNHPPLMGWLLVLLRWLEAHGVSHVAFMIRVPASFADIVTALLIFELVRVRRSLREATAAAVMVLCSPALFIISGFHGNTDPIFVMFTLLSAYLLVTRRSGAVAGLSLAVALSVKLVPVILVPLLLFVVARQGRRRFGAFLAASGAFMALLWGPVVLTRWPEFKANVLDYAGMPLREWGPVQFATWLQLPQKMIALLISPGRFVVLLACILLPLVIVWRRPDAVATAVGMSLALFLLLSPAFSMQYLVWPLAAVYLVNVWAATAYNFSASALMVVVYDNWNQAHPWNWYQAWAVPFRPREFVLSVLAWESLAAVVVVGVVELLRNRHRGAQRSGSGSGSSREPGSAAASGVSAAEIHVPASAG